MNQKLPYYMVYPMPLVFDDERIERMDFEYLKSMYPDVPKRLLPYVEEECDRMEYENSMVYDQYPDKLQLKLMCGRICDNVCRHERLDISASDRSSGRKSDMGADIEAQSIRDLVEVMLFQEIYRRRCDHRRRCRRLF